MGLWQLLANGYDANPELWKLYPLSTTSVSNNSQPIVVVVLDGRGFFRRFKIIKAKTEPVQEFLLPVSQEPWQDPSPPGS